MTVAGLLKCVTSLLLVFAICAVWLAHSFACSAIDNVNIQHLENAISYDADIDDVKHKQLHIPFAAADLHGCSLPQYLIGTFVPSDSTRFHTLTFHSVLLPSRASPV
jgi:hypothetical protein